MISIFHDKVYFDRRFRQIFRSGRLSDAGPAYLRAESSLIICFRFSPLISPPIRSLGQCTLKWRCVSRDWRTSTSDLLSFSFSFAFIFDWLCAFVCSILMKFFQFNLFVLQTFTHHFFHPGEAGDVASCDTQIPGSSSHPHCRLSP